MMITVQLMTGLTGNGIKMGPVQLVVGLVVLLLAGVASGHKYASHRFDARIDGAQIEMNVQLDTVSTIEMLVEQKGAPRALLREGVIEWRDTVYRYLNERLVITSSGASCEPSTLFNFQYLPKVDKFGVMYRLDCPKPVTRMDVDFTLFVEQTGMNTTIATVLGKTGGERYVFTRHSRASIDVANLKGRPRTVKKLMRNYDPLTGFRAEEDRLAALGQKETDAPAKTGIDTGGASGEGSTQRVPFGDGWHLGFGGWFGQGLFGLFLLALLLSRQERVKTHMMVGTYLLALLPAVLLGAQGLVRFAPVVGVVFAALALFYITVENGWSKAVRHRAKVSVFTSLVHGVWLGGQSGALPARWHPLQWWGAVGSGAITAAILAGMVLIWTVMLASRLLDGRLPSWRRWANGAVAVAGVVVILVLGGSA